MDSMTPIRDLATGPRRRGGEHAVRWMAAGVGTGLVVGFVAGLTKPRAKA